MKGLVEIKKALNALNKTYPRKPFKGDKVNDFKFDKKYFFAKWDKKLDLWEIYCNDYFLYTNADFKEVFNYLQSETSVKMKLVYLPPITVSINYQRAFENQEVFLS